jgi:hypothetical protein
MADTSINKDNVTIYVAAADVDGSSLASSNSVVGEITSVSWSGLEPQRETVNVYGGQVRKKQPRTDYEVSMEVLLSGASATTIERWQKLFMSDGTSTSDPVNSMIMIEALKGSVYDSTGFNNAEITTLSFDAPADDSVTMSLTFTGSSTSELGAANVKSSALVHSSAFFSW